MSAGECPSDAAGSAGANRGTRREFLRHGALAAGAIALGGALDLTQSNAAHGLEVNASRPRRRSPAAPNLLVIMVDELRAPCWFPGTAALDALLPNIASIRDGAVSFERHFTASNNCTPSRGALVTGLYPHQTGCLVTGRSELEAGFPTWGTLLREHGYQTTWWGKWHLSNAPTLEPWGFSGGTFPSPNGGPGQGQWADPLIATQFEQWIADAGGDGPWCTTVSFVNPHDIVWWWHYTRHIQGEQTAPHTFHSLPGNFETPADLIAANKPRLQLSLQDVTDAGFGSVPYTGPQAVVSWCEQRDLYLQLQRDVDVQVGRVLAALGRQRQVHDNTVVLFTSDHGEYGGSHGLRGKGGAVYEEGISVPLFVKDPRGELTRAPEVPRRQLSSSVDIAPLLLSIATGSEDWRREPRYAYLAERANLAAICGDPGAPGRPWIAHSTDEVATEFCPTAYPASAPRQVVAVRTERAKYALYSNWRAGTFEIDPRDEDRELYDYSTTFGRLELENVAGHSHLEQPLHELLVNHVVPREMQAPLPSHLRDAQALGRRNYFQVADTAIDQSVDDRLRHIRRPSTHVPVPPPDAVPSWAWQPDPFTRPRGTSASSKGAPSPTPYDGGARARRRRRRRRRDADRGVG